MLCKNAFVGKFKNLSKQKLIGLIKINENEGK